MSKKNIESEIEVLQIAVERLEQLTSTTEQHIESLTRPIRQHVLKRFPVLFLLLVTFGVSATYLGIERFLLSTEIFSEHPIVLFVAGVATLVLTGTLYKKLG